MMYIFVQAKIVSERNIFFIYNFFASKNRLGGKYIVHIKLFWKQKSFRIAIFSPFGKKFYYYSFKLIFYNLNEKNFLVYEIKMVLIIIKI